MLREILPTFSPGTEIVSRGDTHSAPVEALNYFAKLFRLVLAELALTIGIVSRGWEIFICKTIFFRKTLEMSQEEWAEHG